jgi:hypothetical protein
MDYEYVNEPQPQATAPETTRRVRPPGSVDLGQVLIRASIDYVTVQMPSCGRVPLPELEGKPAWVRGSHYSRLSIHDATPADVKAMVRAFGPLPLVEMEVSVDVRPRPHIVGDARQALFKSIMIAMFAWQLEPRRASGMTNKFRAYYRRDETGNWKVAPFNFRPPLATDQQLHGGRNDECQTKAYWKRTDHKRALPEREWKARVEARLGQQALEVRGVITLADLIGFRFRKQLMPFFSHVQGSRRRAQRSNDARKAQTLLSEGHEMRDSRLFDLHGVGALLDGLKVPPNDIVLVRDTAVNERIGQALMRLERKFRA